MTDGVRLLTVPWAPAPPRIVAPCGAGADGPIPAFTSKAVDRPVPHRRRTPAGGCSLFQNDRSALLLDLGLELLGLRLGDCVADRARRIVHQLLGFLQSEARDLTDHLDDLDQKMYLPLPLSFQNWD